MWKLVQPPGCPQCGREGGLGMSPLVAAELTREQAVFYLQDEKQVLADTFHSLLRIDRSNNMNHDDATVAIDRKSTDRNKSHETNESHKTKEQVVEDSVEEYYAKLRLKHTLTTDKHAEAD